MLVMIIDLLAIRLRMALARARQLLVPVSLAALLLLQLRLLGALRLLGVGLLVFFQTQTRGGGEAAGMRRCGGQAGAGKEVSTGGGWKESAGGHCCWLDGRRVGLAREDRDGKRWVSVVVL
jgi:hypothetical protein